LINVFTLFCWCSGEEEAIFSWAATNFVLGTLLSRIDQGSNANHTHGTLDLSDSSAQMAFYVPSRDVAEGLYTLQIGGENYWNVYTKSFLQFGVLSARLRHLTELADQFAAANPVQQLHTRAPGGVSSSLNYCFHAGYSENAMDSTGSRSVEISGPLVPLQDQLDRCVQSVRGLMERKFGRFCSEINRDDCSIGSAYQPPLPAEQFVLQSAFRYPWRFLLMPSTGSLQLFRSRAEQICALNFGDLLFYFESNNLSLDPIQLNLHLPYYCFMASYVLVLLQGSFSFSSPFLITLVLICLFTDGFRFKPDQTLMVLGDVSGRSSGWSLGAMLYEINDVRQRTGTRSGTGEHSWQLVMLGAMLGKCVST
jgi:hypothetical protein